MGIFEWVGDLTAWHWLAMGILFIAFEMLLPSFVIVWPGLAAIVIAALVALFPELGGEWLVLIFAVLSIVFIFVGRGLAMRLRDTEPASTLNSRAGSMVGRQAKVVEFASGEGKVVVSGVQWPAVWLDGQVSVAGDMVVVEAAKGVSLSVKNL